MNVSNETETIIKQQLKRENSKLITNTITSNETAIKEILEQCKLKSTLKIRATEEQPRSRKRSYAQARNTNTNTSAKEIQEATTKSNPTKQPKINISQPSKSKTKTRDHLVEKHFKIRYKK